ncbi:hypothetical protein P3T76_002891 [Phytophthora citrophthora]|uniref:Uncharacterized protein n=1 Tax=Phytophthora citrophthora TaxID=4793 RepID=A0AAD9GXG1_9STRA|nr:hypothetical protein P3T76_002891 [Phytophthora citrophthora]
MKELAGVMNGVGSRVQVYACNLLDAEMDRLIGSTSAELDFCRVGAGREVRPVPSRNGKASPTPPMCPPRAAAPTPKTLTFADSDRRFAWK